MSVKAYPSKGDGWWVIDYRPDGYKGKRVRIPFNGPEGEARLLEQELRRSPGQINNEIVPKLNDLLAPWLEYYRNEVAISTHKDAITSVAHWLPFFGNFKPSNISRKTINHYKSQRLSEPTNNKAIARGEEPKYTSKRTINKELSYLSSCLRWAVENNYCPELPFKIRGFPAKQTKAVTPQVLTHRQLTLMYEVIEPQYKLLFLLMADMGLRRSEALSAVVEDVDDFHETISVVGKGDKQRIVPWLSDRLATELKEALDKRPSGPLSINPKTGRKFNQIVKCLNRAAKNAGLNRNVNPHLLRHSCLTNLARKGMNAHALQQIAGHSSIETTNKIYVHIRSDFVGEEARRIRSMNSD